MRVGFSWPVGHRSRMWVSSGCLFWLLAPFLLAWFEFYLCWWLLKLTWFGLVVSARGIAWLVRELSAALERRRVRCEAAARVEAARKAAADARMAALRAQVVEVGTWLGRSRAGR